MLFNGTIRYAHRISFTSSVLFRLRVAEKYPKLKVESRLYVSIRDKITNLQDSKLRAIFKEMLRDYEVSVVRYMISTSSSLIIFSIISVGYYFLLFVVQKGVRQLKEGFQVAKNHTRRLLREQVKDAEYQVYIGIQDKPRTVC
ncbi:hypothetical protein EHQ53_08495 [Leptospira langatensis]|uniref:Uncharacterized protein n=1 Tax=Leptospira langatensis TaxID=2484983 RepID=A0A5F1ZVC5_9LEPT|nr:hypothetical protein [Leptospira langatensis]TGK01332.1 hypothetical protein EHO57_10375 [Leptospira langatensis]TGL42216.1 hypothetical protein EHQ53_08495 [Leptospira langatensis]